MRSRKGHALDKFSGDELRRAGMTISCTVQDVGMI